MVLSSLQHRKKIKMGNKKEYDLGIDAENPFEYYGTDEGYLKVNIDGDDFDWEYVDYGWEAKKE